MAGRVGPELIFLNNHTWCPVLNRDLFNKLNSRHWLETCINCWLDKFLQIHEAIFYFNCIFNSWKNIFLNL